MALAQLPYKWKLVSMAAAGPLSFELGVTVTDAAGAVRLATKVNLARTATWSDIQAAAHGCLEDAMLADAGTKVNAITQIIASGVLFT